jgi:hypothetical protein
MNPTSVPFNQEPHRDAGSIAVQWRLGGLLNSNLVSN